jgi:ketopantoate reductase
MASETKAKILLVGAGGVGAMACYALESGGGAEVTAVLRSNYEAVMKDGFSIDSIEHGKGIHGFRPTHILDHIPKAGDDKQAPFEYVVVTTKNVPDIRPNVLDLIEPAVTPGVSTIVLLQNGYNIEQPIIERFPNNIVLSGVSIISASEPRKGYILHEFTDTSKIGPSPSLKTPKDKSQAAAKRFVGLYNRCGKVNCQYDEDVNFTRWRKCVLYHSTRIPCKHYSVLTCNSLDWYTMPHSTPLALFFTWELSACA